MRERGRGRDGDRFPRTNELDGFGFQLLQIPAFVSIRRFLVDEEDLEHSAECKAGQRNRGRISTKQEKTNQALDQTSWEPRLDLDLPLTRWLVEVQLRSLENDFERLPSSREVVRSYS